MLTAENTKKWMDSFYRKIEENKDYLSELDTPIGDGDHGNNMMRGMDGVKNSLAQLQDPDLKTVLKAIAMGLISKVGGASGPLYGTAFLEMAKKCSETQKVNELLSVALAGIKKRGGATEGDKTMVDVWSPVAQSNAITPKIIDDAIASTKDMQARKGRASYLGERSIGHLDPGAVSSGYLFTALLETEGTL
ncbi:phosphoenolpyruvate-dihydroxyacetone phosphotransferase [Liquorilactobacillus sucicola DSM 21376 = JCM 15457]|uniref:phosphoenolpyruvate--glycerone phosphotransferase n=1 Tax=Liquorilactobacillus sucicola DSM 21376 = JCM 15457 TaxID=1423806 RepID=A0A023CYE0_9LACO|nr:dihydroxyacetone kinase subunit DhaL [Liquorilactobacillus sucicola]KRN07111.1 dihydroxyacetone kinase [Liquorilactobacillus sucicola DSM 21376 = JCM 15457]GAJ26606.1 phosphoenolpyruvate-dihydroxyacetone phosphotransferase [Liquorilactobacillus sucicola DSM 21376 = JCM 15457]